MTKKEYLSELQKELKVNNIREINDILKEYSDHFDFKMEEGFTEEEIAIKLSTPQIIAKEYASNNVPVNKFEKLVKTFGVVMLSVPLSMLYILMWSAVVVLGVFSFAMLLCGCCLITTLNIAGLIPFIPYLSSLFLGVSSLGLSLLSAIGTIYMSLYVKQWAKIYIGWSKKAVNAIPYVSIFKHPNLSKKVSSKLKLLAIIGLICFSVMFIVGYFVCSLQANAFEFWHVWHWFV